MKRKISLNPSDSMTIEGPFQQFLSQGNNKESLRETLRDSFVMGDPSYFATPSMNRWKMAATWERMALPAGVRVVLEVPVTRPWLTAQPMASRAYSEMFS